MHSVQSLVSLGARVRVRGTTCPIMDVTGSPHQIVMIAYFCFVLALAILSFLQPSPNILCAMISYEHEFVEFSIKSNQWQNVRSQEGTIVVVDRLNFRFSVSRIFSFQCRTILIPYINDFDSIFTKIGLEIRTKELGNMQFYGTNYNTFYTVLTPLAWVHCHQPMRNYSQPSWYIFC